MVFVVWCVCGMVCGLSAVTENSRAIGDKQEVDCRCNDNKTADNVLKHGASVRQVEFTSSRNVNVSTGLISAWVQTERHEQTADILGGVQVSASIVISQVRVEECAGVFLVDVNTVGRNSDALKRGSP